MLGNTPAGIGVQYVSFWQQKEQKDFFIYFDHYSDSFHGSAHIAVFFISAPVLIRVFIF